MKRIIKWLKDTWKKAQSNPEHKRRMAEIEEYWDEKTKYVHRRALLLGVLLGFLLGVFFTTGVFKHLYLLYPEILSSVIYW